MPDIMLVLSCLSYQLESTTVRRLARIAEAMLSMTGRVTQRGLSRWTERGGSYRTVQRWFHSSLDWTQVHWLLIKTHLLGEQDEWILAADEVVVTKAGKHTHGLARFFSSIYGKTVPGLCFLSVSLISVSRRCSYPLRLEPIVKDRVVGCSKASKSAKTAQAKGVKGRPKGSRNRNHREVELSPYLQFVQGIIRQVVTLIGTRITLRYLVFDGAFGHNAALQMVRRCDLELISKLRHNSALYLPYEGPYSGRGRRRKYGAKLHYRQLPAASRKSSSVQGEIHTALYQLSVWHKKFPDLLNVVVVLKTNQRTGAQAHVLLFSSDLTLDAQTLLAYYQLRFQIEFNFREAKQYWGLEDFMAVNETPVYNSANLAMFMINLSQILRQPLRENCPDFSVNDLKAHYRGRKYVMDALQCLPHMPEPIIIEQVIEQAANRGRINQPLKAA